MKDFRRCDNCMREVKDEAAIGWWEAKRIYPTTWSEGEQSYDFCSYQCLEKWVEQRREDNK